MRLGIIAAGAIVAGGVVGGAAVALARRLKEPGERAWPAYGLALHLGRFSDNRERIEERPWLLLECGRRSYRVPLR